MSFTDEHEKMNKDGHSQMGICKRCRYPEKKDTDGHLQMMQGPREDGYRWSFTDDQDEMNTDGPL